MATTVKNTLTTKVVQVNLNHSEAASINFMLLLQKLDFALIQKPWIPHNQVKGSGNYYNIFITATKVWLGFVSLPEKTFMY